MKLKEKLAKEYAQHIKKTDSPKCDPVNVAYDWLQGFEKAREILADKYNTQADWAFEGANQGEATLQECVYAEYLLRYAAKRIVRIGEEEV